MFTLEYTSEKSRARSGKIVTSHGVIETPFFMTIGTKAAVKTLGISDLEALSPPILLSNTYHLMLRPGMDIMEKAGGLHSFMKWDKPILTDSGGYQVFSLAKFRKIVEEGVTFQSHIDGAKYNLTPEKAIEIQQTIGSDIMMCLDECVAYPSDKEYVKRSIELTTRWAKRCLEYKNKNDAYRSNDKQFLFAITQGSTYEDLRIESTKQLIELDMDGYAIGGLAVGEPREEMYSILESSVPLLPKDKPRYLMGVGYPEEIVQAVLRGVDMFDCVIPTREGRHGRLFQFIEGGVLTDNSFYQSLNITNAKYATDFTPIDPDSSIKELRQYSKAYLHHLFKTKEMLGYRLATLNNVSFYLRLMERLRSEIKEGIL